MLSDDGPLGQGGAPGELPPPYLDGQGGGGDGAGQQDYDQSSPQGAYPVYGAGGLQRLHSGGPQQGQGGLRGRFPPGRQNGFVPSAGDGYDGAVLFSCLLLAASPFGSRPAVRSVPLFFVISPAAMHCRRCLFRSLLLLAFNAFQSL